MSTQKRVMYEVVADGDFCGECRYQATERSVDGTRFYRCILFGRRLISASDKPNQFNRTSRLVQCIHGEQFYNEQKDSILFSESV